ncbi:MAG: DinB family protein [Thermoanaerobaculia bacterium]
MKGTVVSGRPISSEYAPYYDKYSSLVPETDLVLALETQLSPTLSFLRSIAESKTGHRYAPEKWTVEQVLRHIVDSERVFAFRAFWFARAAATELPGFEQDDFMRTSPTGVGLAHLTSEFERLRQDHILFFETLDPEAWRRTGTASGNPFTVRALASIMVGHVRHHEGILRDRYLKP